MFEGLAYKNCCPCFICGDSGEQVWLSSLTERCYDCRRRMTMPKSTAMTFPKPNEKDYEPLDTTLEDYLSESSRAIVLNGPDDLQLAAGIINDLKERKKWIEAEEDKVVGPITLGLNHLKSWFSPRKKLIEEARVVWDDKIRDAAEADTATRRAGKVALQTAIDRQDAPAAAQAMAALAPAAPIEGVTMIPNWDFEEINHDIVPTSLTTISRSAVLAELKRQCKEYIKDGLEPQPAVPGCRVFRRDTVKASG